MIKTPYNEIALVKAFIDDGMVPVKLRDDKSLSKVKRMVREPLNE